PVLLLVSGLAGVEPAAVLTGPGWMLLRFDDPNDAVRFTAEQDPPPVLVGGALDWQKAIHPTLPEGWDPGWPPL
ncbi:MAG: hypothetical protein VX000_17585, partial [Myxococcota bacterium]|nr:hypothetical protein [Myxococcota bacterium]